MWLCARGRHLTARPELLVAIGGRHNENYKSTYGADGRHRDATGGQCDRA